VAYQRVGEIEASLLGHIDAAQADLARMECLDEEQRAEVHAILDALRHEGQAHAFAVRQLCGEYRNA
jgi:hypothetical protein